MIDINSVIKKIKFTAIEKFEETILKIPNDEELEVLTDLFKTYSKINCEYYEEELSNLKLYKVPEIVIKFYSEFSVIECTDLGGDILFLSLEEIVKENTELVPGAILIRYGYLTIASTTGGNAICLDLNNISLDGPRIIIADKSIFCNKDNIIIFKNGELIEEKISHEVINKYAVEINKSFLGFIDMIANKNIIDVEDYLD